MEALERGPIAATWTLALALVVGKLVGTTAALGAGAPGGVLSPTMGVAGGTALLVLLAADSLGVGVDHPWDAMVAAMAIGVAVGMRSPLVAIFLIPELLGDYTLVLPIAVVVGASPGSSTVDSTTSCSEQELASRPASTTRTPEPSARVMFATIAVPGVPVWDTPLSACNQLLGLPWYRGGGVANP